MEKNRTKSAVITLAVGLACNIALGTTKLIVGLLADSSSVTSDAVNNVSDAAVSIVTIIATALAARRADREHPYGHGRYEYIATLLIGAVIIAVGAEVLFGGIKRAVYPESVAQSAWLFGVLGGSIAVKLGMAIMYLARGRHSGSDTMKAAAVDSFSDAAVTTVVLACALIERFTGALIDGYASIAVSLVILVMGIKILKRTVSRLIGERPDPQLYSEIEGLIKSNPLVLSVHDIMINDYGAANKTAEADAVFDSKLAFADVHKACDGIEREVREKTGVKICLHADPLCADDVRLIELQSRVDEAVRAFSATAHDLEIDDERKTVSLDIAVGDEKCPTAELTGIVEAQVRAALPDYEVSIGIDYV